MVQQYAPLSAFSIHVKRNMLPVLMAVVSLSASAQTYTTVGNAGTQSAAGSGPNPYVAVDNTSRGTRQQYIIRGQEMLDAGIPANAQIVSVGFNITLAATSGGNVQNLSNWQVSLFSNTNPASTSPLGSWVSSPLVASSVPATLNVGTTGWNHTVFAAPYVWPGASTNNIIIQACYNNASTNGNNSNTHARVQRTTNLSTTVGVRSRWLIGNSTSGICDNTASLATTNDFLRPMVQIGWTLVPVGPTPGNTLASVNPVICGATTLSMQTPGTGATYLWQSSTDNVTYGDIGGATSATYNASPAVATWYRCEVTANAITVPSTPVQVTVSAPNPGATTGPTTVSCQAATVGIATAQTAGVTYQWEASTNGDVGANYAPTGGTASTYSATMAVPTWFRCRVSCPTTGLSTYSIALLVTPNEPDAGNDASLTACSTAAPTNMFILLGSDAQAGGTWSGPSPVTNSLFDPATMVAGNYTYTVVGTAPCLNATATVSVVIDPCLGIQEEGEAAAFQWSGQQADGTHLFRTPSGPVKGIRVYDANGRMLQGELLPTADQQARVAFGKLPSGIYIVELTTASASASMRVVHLAE